MEIGIPVEVEGTFGEFYSGVVYGIDSTDEYHVNLLDSSNSTIVMEVHIPPSSMRLPPDVAAFPFDPMQGQEVDVLIPCCSNPSESSADSESETQPITKLSAWWPGQVKKVAGSFVIVELASAFSTEAIPERPNSHDVVVINNRISIPLPSSILKTDVVEKHQLRPRSHQTNFDPASFHMHNIDVPDALVPYCREPANYVQFARRCGLPILVCMAPDSLRPSSPIHRDDGETYELRARLLVISTDVSTVKRAAVIDNTFIEMLQQKVQILQQTEELSRKLEASRVSQMPAPFVEFLRVPESLIPQAIGHQGSNIRKASAVEGIISIKLDRLECTFRISGKTQEAVQEAKALMDYSIEIVPVPRTYVGPILGSGQRHIQHIVDRIGLSGMRISGALAPDVPDFVAFQLTGTRRAIADAKMFLEFHIASLRELDELRGVKSPPLVPPATEATRDGDSSADQPDHHGPGRQISTRRQKKRELRAAQHGRLRASPQQTGDFGNGDGAVESGEEINRDSGPDTDQSEQRAGRSTNQEIISSGNSRPPRQRRAQDIQSNNNAPPNQRELHENVIHQKKVTTHDPPDPRIHVEPYMNGTSSAESPSFRPPQLRKNNQTSRTLPSATTVGTAVM